MSRYYSPKLRKQIADAMELSMMSHATGLAVGDPSLAKDFRSMATHKSNESFCVFREFGAGGVPYAAARISCPLFYQKGDELPVSYGIVDSRGEMFRYHGLKGSHALYCMKNVPGLRKNTSVDYWENRFSSMRPKDAEREILGLFNSSVNVLVLDSAKYTYRLDDDTVDPKEEGGIGGGYFYGRMSERIFDIMSPGTSHSFVFDALELKTRWVRTTFIKAASYFTGESVYATKEDGKRIRYIKRGLAVEPVSSRSIGSYSMEMFGEGSSGRPRYMNTVERMLEGDVLVEEDESHDLHSMSSYSMMHYIGIYESVTRGTQFDYPLPYRTLKL